MKPKISLITLGVSDLERARTFYQQLGFSEENNSNESVVFFDLEGTWLGLFPREELAKDAQIALGGGGFSGVTLAHNVSSETEVDAVIEHAKNCGATIQKAPEKVFWGGHSGYFADPDGHLWEVAFNPFMDLT